MTARVGRSLPALAVLGLLAAACGHRGKAAASPGRPHGPLCDLVQVVSIPARSQHVGPGRWSVLLPVEGPVLKAHEHRFARYGILPNGEAWAGLVEQCMPTAKAGLSPDIHLDPEAGSLHAWVESDGSKALLVDFLCRAVDDVGFLERCLAGLDRSKLDD